MKVFYFADIERMITPLDVNKLSPKNVYTKDNKKFWRRSKSWLWRRGSSSFVVWLGKVGKGITYRLEQNKDENGKKVIEKLGSLWDGIEQCLKVDEYDIITKESITDEAIEKLRLSNIFVCVDLEVDPSDVPSDFDEDSAVSEANKSMANLIASTIRDLTKSEDWIRNAGLMAIGALALFLAQSLGLL